MAETNATVSYHLENATNFGSGRDTFIRNVSSFEKKYYIADRRIDEFLKASKGKRVLDVGCGAARWSIAAALHGAASVDGLDLQPEMIALGKEKAAESSVSHCVNLQVGDLCDMNYAINSKDRIISIFVACNLPLDNGIFSKHFTQIARTLDIGGEALVAAPTSMGVLFTKDGTGNLQILEKIEKIMTSLGSNPSTVAISEALQALPEVYIGTFVKDEHGKLYLNKDNATVKEGQSIWMKVSNVCLHNCYHSDASYEEEFKRAGLKVVRVLKERFSSEKERKEFNERAKTDFGPEFVHHPTAALYYVTKTR